MKKHSYLIYDAEQLPIREIGNPLLITTRCDLIKTLKIDGVEQDLDGMGKERTPHVFTATTKYEKIEEILALLDGEESDKYIFTLNETEAFKQYKVEIEWFDNITECIYAFDDCAMLLSIPNDLFENCTEVTSFSNTFRGCTSLTSIPEGLFATNTAVTDFINTFSDCINLTSIPSNLFTNNKLVTDFSSTFSNCINLTSIPSNLFTNNKLVTDFINTFSNCDGLTSIPEGLFTNNTSVTSFSNTFRGCTSLTSIPEGLFATNTEVTSFSYTFYECSSLLIMPKDNDGTPIYNRSEEGKKDYEIVTDYHLCFCGCEKIKGYESVPKKWTCSTPT